jgi:hypothetical protein
MHRDVHHLQLHSGSDVTINFIFRKNVVDRSIIRRKKENQTEHDKIHLVPASLPVPGE